MPVQTATAQPVYKQIGEANSWAVVKIAINTPLVGALSVDVTVQARKLASDGVTELSILDPQVLEVTGAPLATLMATAYTAAKAAEANGADAGAALYAGIKSAVYGALQAQGVIPAAAQ